MASNSSLQAREAERVKTDQGEHSGYVWMALIELHPVK